jgi:AcrR family transcriptional regulator
VGNLQDRRARKKAQTRAEIRGAAQGLFAEHGFDAVTIADVAAAADVAVQTVFNHFATKEELFFDGRAPWVDEPAEAVRGRRPGEAPLSALRDFTVRWIRESAAASLCDERRLHVRTLEASASLRAFELELQRRAEQRLGTALTEAWSRDPAAGPGAHGTDLDTRVAASLTAALWIAGARALLVELRTIRTEGADAAAIRGTVAALGERLFDRLELGLGTLLQLQEPAADIEKRVRRAG